MHAHAQEWPYILDGAFLVFFVVYLPVYMRYDYQQRMMQWELVVLHLWLFLVLVVSAHAMTHTQRHTHTHSHTSSVQCYQPCYLKIVSMVYVSDMTHAGHSYDHMQCMCVCAHAGHCRGALPLHITVCKGGGARGVC